MNATSVRGSDPKKKGVENYLVARQDRFINSDKGNRVKVDERGPKEKKKTDEKKEKGTQGTFALKKGEGYLHPRKQGSRRMGLVETDSKGKNLAY